jgi:RecB family exonuclease
MTRRISASRLNSIDQCTMKYYMGEILGLPEKIWARTHAGSAAHSVLECLARAKHRKHLDMIKRDQSIYTSPPVARLVRAWQAHTKMPDEIVADIDSMCMVAINHSNFLDEGAVTKFEPEHEFTMTLSNGGMVRGFIDRMAEYPNSFVIKDYKTARNKFTKADVADSYQSLVYQLYVWKTFGKLAEVQYIFLRHPPTTRTKDKHIMVTKPATPEQLAGFERYLAHMWEKVNAFGLDDAHSGYCQDEGFCERVCTYRRPYDYYTVVDETGQTISAHMLDNPPNPSYNQKVEVRHCSGCPRYNPI